MAKFKTRCVILRIKSVEASKLFPDESPDFVHIDGNHAYEFVKKDIGSWWPKVKKGGLFTGHDYMNASNNFGEFDVKRAVDEFVKETDKKLYLGKEGIGPTWVIKA